MPRDRNGGRARRGSRLRRRRRPGLRGSACRFPSGRGTFGRGADFVGTETKQMFALAVDAAHVRAEKFVGRAGEEIAIQRADVDGAVRRVMDCVDERECAGGVGEADNFFDGIDCAHGVRCVAYGDEAGARGDFPAEIVEIERAVFRANVDLTDDDAAFFQGAPGATLASWSSVVTTISSPERSSRPIARDSAKVRVVMLGPKKSSSGAQSSRSAMAARAEAMSASERRLVANAPQVFALIARNIRGRRR